jgi:hypothetical protein
MTINPMRNSNESLIDCQWNKDPIGLNDLKINDLKMDGVL